MILILSHPDDEHVELLAEKLHARGANFRIFDHAQLPSSSDASLFYSPTGKTGYTLRVNGETINLNQLTTVWYRRPTPPVPHVRITDLANRRYVEEECENFLQNVWNCLDCCWVPAIPTVIQRAGFKASQLKLAATLGLEIPPTLITNNPSDFLDFYQHHNGHVISKVPGSSFRRHAGHTFSRCTEVVSKRDVGYAQSVRYCPAIFQAYVPKRFELRITVVGQKVFAAEIHSQHTNRTRHDWRRYDHGHTPYYPHELPPDVGQRCVRLVEKFGLCYGTIDMVFTPDERYVFLEINANGQYLWIENATGLPISDALVELLCTGRSQSSQASASSYGT